jgi:hypothetical protein
MDIDAERALSLVHAPAVPVQRHEFVATKWRMQLR